MKNLKKKLKKDGFLKKIEKIFLKILSEFLKNSRNILAMIFIR